jgi:hypothetical protein
MLLHFMSSYYVEILQLPCNSGSTVTSDLEMLHLMPAASTICNMSFNTETFANDLLLAIVAKRIPELAGFPKNDHPCSRECADSQLRANLLCAAAHIIGP